ncbi:hypothetical protein [Cellulomonas alba]|uniref:SpaA-like prealbumin fold domain-containing protein n=1 Tax=Cellulomonas alba TaxID=3053467 RepID=A0ABT7SJS0_9CELL|nr:hypothetical protein [Cellulomonas alba]MDM7856428.1 hypothetical protein [Cellulomonas alba]
MATLVVGVLVAVLSGVEAAPAAAQVDPNVTGQLSLFKRIENLDTGSSEGRRELWQMHAVNTEDATYTFSGDGLNGFQTRTIPAGSYTISESGGVAGYQFVSWDCGAAGTFTSPTPTITVPANGQLTCTVRNDAVKPRLTLRKVVEGGPANPSSWNLQAQGPTTLHGPTGVSGTVPIGQYTLSEANGPSGYDAGPWVCVGGTQTSSTTVALTLGQDVTCTITNTRAVASPHLLTLRKVVDGGPATTADFTLSASGGGSSVSGVSGSDAVTGVPVPSGTYTLAETPGPGVVGYTASAWTCSAGTVSGSTLTLSDADGDPTCTITNTFVGGTLTLVKEVAGGSLLPIAWTLTASGPATFSGRTGQPAVTGVPVPVGSYTLSEQGPQNYTASPWSCTSGATGPSTVQVTAGADITCTITNTIQGGSLTLLKVVDNAGGGTALPTDFSLRAVDAVNGIIIAGTAGSDAVTAQAVDAGTTWALGEVPVPGYTAGDWTCTGATATNDQVTIPPTTDVVCTVTNTWHGGFLTLTKRVAGSATPPQSWTLTATGDVTVTGRSGTADVTRVPVPVGDYVLSESTVAGYAPSAFDCGGAPLTGATVTVGDGADVVCTVVNTATQPHLSLLKVVDNSGGGTLPVSAWTLAADGPVDVEGASGSAAVTLAPVDPGSYALSETPGTTAGYSAGPWVCLSGGAELPVSGTGDLTIPATAPDGTDFTADVVCTITNTAVAPRLTLVKEVDNHGGGVAQPTAFTLLAIGDTDLAAGTTGTPQVTDVPLRAGEYDLLEIGLPHYTRVGWTCVDGLGATLPLAADTVDLELGEDVTCTVLNRFADAQLTLVKTVDGGPASAGDWTLVASSGAESFGGVSGSAQATRVVTPATFALSEVPGNDVARLGYELVGWDCGSHAVTGASVVLAAGDEVTCTATNRWIGSSLTLTKEVEGGTAAATDWTLTADGPQRLSGATGAPAVTDAVVVPGDYTLAETGPAGYSSLGWTCTGATVSGDVVTIGENADVACTVTNRADPVPPPTPTPTTPPTPTPTDTGGGAPPPQDGVLGATGTDAASAVGVAALALALGVAAVAWAARVRRTRRDTD